MRRQKSNLYEKETEIREMVEKGFSATAILQKLGLNDATNFRRLREVCKKFGIPFPGEYDIVRCRNSTFPKEKREMFCENSLARGNNIKLQYLKLVEYVCCGCGNNGSYNGKPLSLQMHHVNGINNDHRLENLQLLCPNCHTQTDSFCGRNIKNPARNHIIIPNKEELEKLYSEKSLIEISIIYGCSNVKVGNWLKKYGIPVRRKSAQATLMTEKDREELKRLRHTKSLSEIAQIYSCSVSTIWHCCKKYGIETEAEKIKERKRNKESCAT